MSEENVSPEFRLKNINERRNYLIEEINQIESKGLYNSKLYWILSYFSFYNYWMGSHFCFCFFSWYSYRNYEFCNWI